MRDGAVKRSRIDEWIAWEAGGGLAMAGGQGSEQGRRQPLWPRPGAVRGPLAAPANPAGPSRRLRKAAERLVRELSDELPPEVRPSGTRLVEARVTEADARGTARRRIRAAEAFAGGRPLLPRWARTALLTRGGWAWPAGFLGAARRACLAAALPPSPAPPDARWAVDVFAASDLLRLAAAAWSGGGGGERVGPELLEIDDLEFLPAEGPPRALVRAGRRVAPAQRPDPGWRSGSSSGWRILRVRLPAGEPLAGPGSTALVTQVIPLAGGLVAGGILLEDGRPVARWGPRLGPAASRWWLGVRAAAGPAIPDATGWPAVTPALWLAGSPFGAGR